ncbi:hypothetical protein B0T20DRAFT_453958 [Sordaria brevicollis]|uniref:Uncharacterized protein n=1 Tax=Sordaria brevicollis TaxID=83679 RepID=A0AAE0PDD3_SORBR|nr:hypothetical protein B0T20DRAFT_453958 [Sordaria brevicollis]
MEGSWLLFETTDSIIEVLWDIALAFFVIRISFYYFLLTFLSSLVLSLLAYAELLPISTFQHFVSSSSDIDNRILLVAGLLTLTSAVWAHLVIRHYEVPRVAHFRLALCSMSLAFMISAEMVVTFVLYEEGYGGWVWEEMKSMAGVAWGGWMVMYAMMPLLLMGVERRMEEKRERYHSSGAMPLHKLPTINEEKVMM